MVTWNRTEVNDLTAAIRQVAGDVQVDVLYSKFDEAEADLEHLKTLTLRLETALAKARREKGV